MDPSQMKNNENCDPNRIKSSKLDQNFDGLKVGKFKVNKPSNSSYPTINEWTVIYSDSNSSICSDVDSEHSTNSSPGQRSSDESEKVDRNKVVSTAVINAHKNQANTSSIDETSTNESNEIVQSPVINDECKSKSNNENIEPIDLDINCSPNSIHNEFDYDHLPRSANKTQSPPSPISDTEKLSSETESDIEIIAEDDDYEIGNENEDLNEKISMVIKGDDSSLFNDYESLLSLSVSSVISQSSNFSLLREQYLQANQAKSLKHRLNLLDKDNDTVPSDDEISSIPSNQYEIPVVDKNRRIRAYFHTPNTGLNGKLNLILILSVTAVVGLGIGHFIGWSNQWRQQRQLSLGQVMKLKQLQDDLLVCMKNQATSTISQLDEGHLDGAGSANSKVCLHDSDYWKERFKTLFNENKGLIELFQKTQKHFHENGDHRNVIEEHECVNKTTSDEFHNLKLDLLVKQMEHLQLLEVLEEVKNIGQANEKRVRVLEEENLDLKKKLVEEEEDDQVIAESWGTRVAMLETENQVLRQTLEVDDMEDMKVIDELKNKIDLLNAENLELKSIFNQLEKQIGNENEHHKFDKSNEHYEKNNIEPSTHEPVDSTDKDAMPLTSRYDVIRQRINQLLLENEDLKSKIALYRWSNSKNQNENKSPNESGDRKQTTFSSKEVDTFKIKLNILQRQVLIEQSETNRWKNKFEQLVKKLKKLEKKLNNKADRHKKGKKPKTNQIDEQEEGKFTAEDRLHFDDKQDDVYSKYKQDKINIQDDFTSGSGKKDKEKHKQQRMFEQDWKQLFAKSLESGENMWNSFIKQVKRVQRDSKEHFEPLKKSFSQYGKKWLKNTIETVHNLGEKIVERSLNNEVVHYMSDKVVDLAQMAEESINKYLSELDESIRNTGQPNVNEAKTQSKPPKYESNDDHGDQRGRKPDTYSAKERENWMTKRAQNRARQRNFQDPSQASSVDHTTEWMRARARLRRQKNNVS